MGLLIQKTKKSYTFVKNGSKTVGYTVKVAPAAKLSTEELVERVANATGFNASRTMGVIYALVETMVDYLALGHAVQMGGFGTFRPSVNTKLSDDLGDASADNIKRIKLIFTPGKAFRQMLAGATLEMSSDDSDTLKNDGSTGSNENENENENPGSGSGTGGGGDDSGSGSGSGDGGGHGAD